MGKANEQATTTKFQGQSKFTIGGLAESIVKNTYNKIEYYGNTKKKAPNFEYMKKNSKKLTASISTLQNYNRFLRFACVLQVFYKFHIFSIYCFAIRKKKIISIVKLLKEFKTGTN